MIAQLHEVLKLERPLVGIDLETTGVDPKTSGIVELGLEIFVPGKPVKEYRTLVNPLMPIPAGATAIHHITNEMVADAPTFMQLSDNLLKGLGDCDLAGYNVWFDIRQMAEEFKRAGKPWDYEGCRVIDGFRIWQLAEGRTLSHAFERWIRGSRDVSDQMIEDELGVEGAHTALWDVKMSTRIIAAQLKACQTLPRDVQRLHDLQWPDRYDADGKLRWKDKELCFSFGEHRDKPLRTVPDRYLSWVISKDFSDKVKDTCRAALKRNYPQPPMEVPVETDPT